MFNACLLSRNGPNSSMIYVHDILYVKLDMLGVCMSIYLYSVVCIYIYYIHSEPIKYMRSLSLYHCGHWYYNMCFYRFESLVRDGLTEPAHHTAIGATSAITAWTAFSFATVEYTSPCRHWGKLECRPATMSFICSHPFLRRPRKPGSFCSFSERRPSRSKSLIQTLLQAALQPMSQAVMWAQYSRAMCQT